LFFSFIGFVFCWLGVAIFATRTGLASALQGGLDKGGKSWLAFVPFGNISVQVVHILCCIVIVIDTVFVAVYRHEMRPFS